MVIFFCSNSLAKEVKPRSKISLKTSLLGASNFAVIVSKVFEFSTLTRQLTCTSRRFDLFDDLITSLFIGSILECIQFGVNMKTKIALSSCRMSKLIPGAGLISVGLVF